MLLVPACSSASSDTPAPGCANGAKDEGEEGIDCGGICPTKCTGSGCTTGAECASGTCESGTCDAPDGKPCGVAVATQCNEGDTCELDKDCKTGFCAGGTCAVSPDGPPGPTDGKKNGDETDVDCGGPTAPAYANGKACVMDGDCTDGYCPPDQKRCVAPRNDDGVKNGTETDVDCGGKSGKTCAAGLACTADGDCLGACNYQKKCIDIPSCKPHLGGDTCGAVELADNADVRESCCRSLPVPGFSDAARPGKAVSLDKYEITAGRIPMTADVVKLNAGDAEGWMDLHGNLEKAVLDVTFTGNFGLKYRGIGCNSARADEPDRAQVPRVQGRLHGRALHAFQVTTLSRAGYLARVDEEEA